MLLNWEGRRSGRAVADARATSDSSVPTRFPSATCRSCLPIGAPSWMGSSPSPAPTDPPPAACLPIDAPSWMGSSPSPAPTDSPPAACLPIDAPSWMGSSPSPATTDLPSAACRFPGAPSWSPLLVPVQHVLQRARRARHRHIRVSAMLVEHDVSTIPHAMGGFARGQHRQPNTRRFDMSAFRPVQTSSGMRFPSFSLGVRLRTVRFHLSATPFCWLVYGVVVSHQTPSSLAQSCDCRLTNSFPLSDRTTTSRSPVSFCARRTHSMKTVNPFAFDATGYAHTFRLALSTMVKYAVQAYHSLAIVPCYPEIHRTEPYTMSYDAKLLCREPTDTRE
ncbi:hypothetical protein CF326_g288 [Tilletia indica]|nr:hypothetical protein CF326_g288 [Tilletia indica]